MVSWLFYSGSRIRKSQMLHFCLAFFYLWKRVKPLSRSVRNGRTSRANKARRTHRKCDDAHPPGKISLISFVEYTSFSHAIENTANQNTGKQLFNSWYSTEPSRRAPFWIYIYLGKPKSGAPQFLLIVWQSHINARTRATTPVRTSLVIIVFKHEVFLFLHPIISNSLLG